MPVENENTPMSALAVRLMKSRNLLVVGSLALLLLSGCQQSLDQKLIGRWYNGTMSIRFREDGGVVLNTPTGRGVGRYVFNPGVPMSANSLEPNITVDMVRNNTRSQIEFHVEFLNGDRLRLVNLSAEVPVRNRRAGVPREFAILKRAVEEIPSGSAVQVGLPW